MISQFFNSGNYNNWENFILVTLPNINNLVKQEIIPQIDEVLISMLGDRSDITKESVNVTQDCSDNLKGIFLDISYIVDDWKVIDAPIKAIESDTQTIRDFLTTDGRTLLDLSIDVTSGRLSIRYYIPIEGEDNE